ncbi:MAG: 50S ribosomal protein L11 methyltransferase [Acidobacteriota bacterium]
MTQNFVEVLIQAQMESGELLGLIDDSGYLGCWEEDGAVHIYWAQDRWNDVVLNDIKRALNILKLADVEPIVNRIEDKDWNATWAASLSPIRLGQRVRVRQSWHPKDPSFEGIELVIDPKRAFGTGYHATTQLVLEWLERTVKGGERVLDVGTGSGILSMVAVRLGAGLALGVDIDPTALQCAAEYASLNGFGSEIQFRVSSFEELKPDAYDLVLANIDGRTLPALCSYLPKLLKKRGRACFSGLQHHDYDEISIALEWAGFSVAGQRQKGEWLSLEIVFSANAGR